MSVLRINKMTFTPKYSIKIRHKPSGKIEQPSNKDIRAVKKRLQYLNGTQTKGVVFMKEDNLLQNKTHFVVQILLIMFKLDVVQIRLCNNIFKRTIYLNA